MSRRAGHSENGRVVALGRGIVAPYPLPTSAAATAIGQANRRRDTKPEVLLRSELHARGLRFRKDHLIRAGGIRVHADVAFTKRRVAVFVDGCFWHMCPDHGRVPKSNLEYWVPKLQANVERDARVSGVLEEHGWRVKRIWEHVDPRRAADEIEELVRASHS